MRLRRSQLFDHVNLKVRDIEKSKRFYKSVIETLGHSFTLEDKDSFHIDELRVSQNPHSNHSIHLTFNAENAAAVRLFYDAALSSGGAAECCPDEQLMVDGNFAAFVRDPDGNFIEARYHPIRI